MHKTHLIPTRTDSAPLFHLPDSCFKDLQAKFPEIFHAYSGIHRSCFTLPYFTKTTQNAKRLNIRPPRDLQPPRRRLFTLIQLSDGSSPSRDFPLLALRISSKWFFFLVPRPSRPTSTIRRFPVYNAHRKRGSHRMSNALDDPRVHANLLILEIGNSHVSVATSIGPSIRTHQRFELDEADKVVDYCEEAWAALPEDHRRALAAASVVPEALDRLRERVQETLNEEMMIVGESLQRPMTLAVEAPELVGIDRVCAAAAAYDGIRGPCAVASFGTAITIDCVNGEGVFMGGAILPGLRLQAASLHEGTAALPEVEVEATGAVFGASTREAICNGILYSVVGGLREIVERYATHLGSWPFLIATGGGAVLVGKECEFIDRTVPDLCLRGIALAYRKHFTPLPESW